ncbi:comm domain-containing protein 4 [Stylonychia lemnae]|uniref:Comm domain-containing protein 4 n=1 Tax=Stylonychia lemnae TaxID=5949 RepID=A0A078AQV3_STYLE|nr:comm domain-containing protein 4 [Stylonychia lemnae]|eukprot:CDW84594.1 comm domain-containing protein 4 [Stylonychia lemnae]
MTEDEELKQEEEILNQFQDLGFGINPSIHLDFSNLQINKMKDQIKRLFNLLRNENNKVDVTQFKAYLHQENVHNNNPTLFKRINDRAKKSNFTEQMDETEFLRFFMASDLLLEDQPPSLYDFVMLFEMLDQDRSGMISASNLRNFLEKAERLKVADFDLKRYEDNLQTREDIKEKYDMIEDDLEDLVAEFDLTGDRLISPEEFYNIIMAFYESKDYMRKFEFCGNMDCPEWVLSEVVQLNKIGASKLKQILSQILRKIFGQAYDQDKLIKLCKDQNLNGDDTKVLLAVLEFILAQAGKYMATEQVLMKDLLQIGIAIENAQVLVKTYVENMDALQKSLKAQSFKVSQIDGMNYKLSYLFANSSSGQAQNLQTGELEALDTIVTVGLDITEFPHNREKKQKYVKFGMNRDKFLQFSRDMKDALALLENAQIPE